jgi:hypothetical protein
MSAKNTQFNKGNYNEWYNLISTQLPLVDDELRDSLLPKIDDTLKSMLGNYSDWTKEELNAQPYVEDDSFKGVYIEVSYLVDDFKVQSVPKEAVEEDEKSITDYLTEDHIEVTNTEIDTNSGLLKLTIIYHFNEDEIETEDEEIIDDKV